MSGVASVSVSGNEVTLTVNDGSKVEFLRTGNRISSGTGQITIDPVTLGGSKKTLADAPVITASGKSLVDQRLILSDLPDEELIVFIGDQGAKRVAMQFDELPEGAPILMRDIEIRVKDAETNTVEFFDAETQTSIATRTLDAESRTSAVGFDFELDGTFDADDKFHISANTSGTGDNGIFRQFLTFRTRPRMVGLPAVSRRNSTTPSLGLVPSFSQARSQPSPQSHCVRQALRPSPPIPASTSIPRRQI